MYYVSYRLAPPLRLVPARRRARAMRVMTGFRLHHWLFLVGLVVAGLTYTGAIDLRAVALWMADRTDTGGTLADPDLGHADALLLVFSAVFLGPLAIAIGCG